jgi:hypothetical protein
LARSVLRAGEHELVRMIPDVATLLATVHKDNAASRRVFVSSGYTPDLPADDRGFKRLLKQPQRAA